MLYSLAVAVTSVSVAPVPVPSVHPDRASQIANITKLAMTWHAYPHPRFADQPVGASKSLLGVHGNWAAEIRDSIRMGEVEEYVPSEATANAEIPASFDSETNWPDCAKIIGDIRDQSNCGCCWAFAGAEAASDRMCIATKAKIQLPLAAEDVCFNAGGFFSSGCNGGQITTPWSFISSKGAVTGGNFKGTGPMGGGFCSAYSLPHCHHHGPQGNDPYPAEGAPGCPSEKSPKGPKKCDAGADADHSDYEADKYTFSGRAQTASGVTAVQQMIMEGGPVETAFTVYCALSHPLPSAQTHCSSSAPIALACAPP